MIVRFQIESDKQTLQISALVSENNKGKEPEVSIMSVRKLSSVARYEANKFAKALPGLSSLLSSSKIFEEAFVL